MSSPWYVLLLRARYEIYVRDFLNNKGYEVVLPTYNKTVACGKERRILFPGYLFCRLSGLVNTKVVTTPGVIGILKFGGRPAVVDDEEIARLQQIERSAVIYQPWRYMPIGVRIRIETGPLAGIEGVLCTTGNARHLIVSVNLLRRSVAVALNNKTEISSTAG